MAYKRILLISADFVKKATTIHSNTDNGMLIPIIEDCQSLFIEKITGTKLLKELETQVDVGVITPLNTTLLNDHIIKTMLRWISAKNLRQNSYKMTNKGTVNMNGDNATTSSDKELIEQSQDFLDRAEYYAQRTTLFLIENEDDYPLYCDNDKIDEINPDRNQYDVGIYLDD